MSTKKSNFLPLLLIGGGVAGAALLFSIGSKQDKDDMSVVDGYGSVGSGDFLGSSGVSKGYDSTDLGIEDFANNRANPDAFALPSDGANPERVIDDSGQWSFNDTAMLGLTAGITAAPYAAKGVKKAVSKAASKGAGQAVKSAGSAAATKAFGGSINKIAQTAVKGAGVAGVVGLVDTFFEITGVKEAHFSQGGLTGNLQGVNMNYTVQKNTITTDTASKENTGNMVTDSQLQHATGLSAGKYPVTVASKEEAAMVNKAVGLSSGDVLKVMGNKFTSYVPEKGMQVTYSKGGSLKQAVDVINATKAKKRS